MKPWLQEHSLFKTKKKNKEKASVVPLKAASRTEIQLNAKSETPAQSME